MSDPLVSCLMVTRDRPELAARAIACFAAQRYSQRELVIVDDGDHDLRREIEPYLALGLRIRYHRLRLAKRAVLGELRNESIDRARGEWCIQWDDDEWYHPDRISTQVAGAAGHVAVALRWTLMTVQSPRHGSLAFRADAGFATPGTVLHRRDAARYPSLSRGEDSQFLAELRRVGRVAVLGRDASHLFVRVFHGGNTWDESHFLRRLHRRPADWPSYALARWWHHDLAWHRSCRLDERERSTIAALRSASPVVPVAVW